MTQPRLWCFSRTGFFVLALGVCVHEARPVFAASSPQIVRAVVRTPGRIPNSLRALELSPHRLAGLMGILGLDPGANLGAARLKEAVAGYAAEFGSRVDDTVAKEGSGSLTSLGELRKELGYHGLLIQIAPDQAAALRSAAGTLKARERAERMRRIAQEAESWAAAVESESTVRVVSVDGGTAARLKAVMRDGDSYEMRNFAIPRGELRKLLYYDPEIFRILGGHVANWKSWPVATSFFLQELILKLPNVLQMVNGAGHSIFRDFVEQAIETNMAIPRDAPLEIRKGWTIKDGAVHGFAYEDPAVGAFKYWLRGFSDLGLDFLTLPDREVVVELIEKSALTRGRLLPGANPTGAEVGTEQGGRISQSGYVYRSESLLEMMIRSGLLQVAPPIERATDGGVKPAALRDDPLEIFRNAD